MHETKPSVRDKYWALSHKTFCRSFSSHKMKLSNLYANSNGIFFAADF